MALAKRPSLSIFLPCYNDSQTIHKLIVDAGKTARKVTRDYEILVIDDGSTDGSRKLLKTLEKKIQRLRVIYHEKNRGYGGVLQTGFEQAVKDLVFYTDGDGQYDVKELEILLVLLSPDVNFVQGIKMERHDYSYRVIMGNMYAFWVRWLFLLKVPDVDCDFRLIRRSLLKKITLTCKSGAVCVELVKKATMAGARFRMVGVHHYDRMYGSSQFFRPMRLVQTAGELIGLWKDLVWSKTNI